MNRLRLEWSIFIKSLRVLKKNRRLLNLLVPEAFLRLLLYGIAAKQIANLILLLFPDPEKPAFDTVEIVFPVVILLFTATAGVLVCRILSAFLLGIFYSEMIRGFGDDGILIKRGLLFAFIKRKALFRWGLNFFRQGKGNVFAVPTIICDEEAEEPDVIRNRVGTTIEHIWHTKGDFKGLLVLKLLLLDGNGNRRNSPIRHNPSCHSHPYIRRNNPDCSVCSCSPCRGKSLYRGAVLLRTRTG